MNDESSPPQGSPDSPWRGLHGRRQQVTTSGKWVKISETDARRLEVARQRLGATTQDCTEDLLSLYLDLIAELEEGARFGIMRPNEDLAQVRFKGLLSRLQQDESAEQSNGRPSDIGVDRFLQALVRRDAGL
jgi:hypothetical protein